jgi:replicative DNA helicase
MIENIDLDILKFMSDRGNYYSYKDVINKGLCTKESWTLIQDFGKYFNEYPNITEIDEDFTLWFRVTGHPGWKPEDHKVYATIIHNVRGRAEPARTVFKDQLQHLSLEATLRNEADKLGHGDTNADDVLAKLHGYSLPGTDGEQSGTYSLDDLAQHQRSDDGYYWRLEDLNQSVGPIRKGDFIVVGKRPEVGGTSFLCSELSHMVEQLPENGRAVLFNNEEAPDKVFTRMVSGALDVDYRTMMGAHALYQQNYEKWLGDKEWDLAHDTSMNLAGIKRYLRGKEYDLIGINVLLKVGGTGAKEDHDKFQALGEEMRRIAQEHGPVLAIVQADPSAEGVRYIPQDRIYKSKTALQGEADVLIMIGSDDDNGPVDSRYIHVAKNKIPPAPCCDLAVKHLKGEVKFDLGTGRFESCTYKGNSRSTKT